MRTTVTLDPDLAAQLRDVAGRRGLSFKDAINGAIRAGLEEGDRRGRPYRERTRNLGVRRGIDLTKALDLAASLEDEETVRELELRR